MDRKWMTTIAGILDIISGVYGIIGGVVLIAFAIASGLLMQYIGEEIPQFVLVVIFLVSGIPYIILGALSLTGGIFCLHRKKWGMALTGSICSLFLIVFLGIASIVFTALSRREFNPTS